MTCRSYSMMSKQMYLWLYSPWHLFNVPNRAAAGLWRQEICDTSRLSGYTGMSKSTRMLLWAMHQSTVANNCQARQKNLLIHTNAQVCYNTVTRRDCPVKDMLKGFRCRQSTNQTGKNSHWISTDRPWNVATQNCHVRNVEVYQSIKELTNQQLCLLAQPW